VNVLIAEDETLIRLDLCDMLERAGLHVCAEAHDGEQAVALARTTEPDVAILDVKMPSLDGVEVARQILRERPIPIVIVSAYTEQALVERAADAGVFGYLAKPFREQDLLPAIATAQARFNELTAVREEVETLSDALAARKAIERAKGILMQKDSLTEDAAFARHCRSCDRGVRDLNPLQWRPDASAAARAPRGAQCAGIRSSGGGPACHYLAGRPHFRTARGRTGEAVAREDGLLRPRARRFHALGQFERRERLAEQEPAGMLDERHAGRLRDERHGA